MSGPTRNPIDLPIELPIELHDVLQELNARTLRSPEAPTLERTRKALDRLSLSINPTKVILVAGGHGASSVAATIQHLLLQAGKNIGLFTAPTMTNITECIRINEADVTAIEFVKIFARVNALTFDLGLTQAETLMLMAVWAFYSDKSKAMDWAIFEVPGNSGKLNPVNAVPHAFSVFTVTDAKPEVAADLFGIIGKGSRAYYSQFSDSMISLVAKTEENLRCKFIQSAGFSHRGEMAQPGKCPPKFTIKTQWGEAALALPGRQGAQNTALALTVFDGLGFSVPHCLDQLKSVRVSGQMELLRDSKCAASVFLSRDCTPEGIRNLLELLPHYGREHLYVLVGIEKDVTPTDILRPLFDLPNTTIALTEAPQNGLRIGDYEEWLDQAKFAHPDPGEAYAALRALAKKKDLVIVVGSLDQVAIWSKNGIRTKT